MKYEAMIRMTQKIEIYQTREGKLPFQDWLDNLPDWKTRVAIELRINRLSMGNFCQCKSLGAGIHELKIDVGPGFRVYFVKIGSQTILLLCAGDKKSQQKDISKARKYFNDYKMEGL